MSDMYFEDLPSTNTPITANNLNKLNDIKVSSTEPTTGEKLWIQKGTNIDEKIYVNENNIYEELINITGTLKQKGRLSNNTDLNNVKEPGIYSTFDSTLTNTPSSNYNWSSLIVTNQNGLVHQYFIKPVSKMLYIRESSGSPATWQDWHGFATTINEVTYANWNNVILTRSDSSSLYLILYGSNLLKTGNYSITNNFQLNTYGTTNSSLTIPSSAVSEITRHDWGFTVIITRSRISGITSGEYNGIAIAYGRTIKIKFNIEVNKENKK